MLFGIGAVVSPLIASELIDLYGTGAMFLYIAGAHAALIAFGVYRTTRRPTSAERTPYTYRPRTSITLERLLGQKRGQKDADP